MFYSLIGPEGNILNSMFTEDSEMIVPDGHRLLPDNPPQPPQIIPGITRALRIEPVPEDATEVVYEIVYVTREARENEVLL